MKEELRLKCKTRHIETDIIEAKANELLRRNKTGVPT